MRSLHCRDISTLIIVALVGWQCWKLHEISLAPSEPHEPPTRHSRNTKSRSNNDKVSSQIEHFSGHDRSLAVGKDGFYVPPFQTDDLGIRQSTGDSLLLHKQMEVGNTVEVSSVLHQKKLVDADESSSSRPKLISSQSPLEFDAPGIKDLSFAHAIPTKLDSGGTVSFMTPTNGEDEPTRKNAMSMLALAPDHIPSNTLGEVPEKLMKGVESAETNPPAGLRNQNQFAFVPLRPSEMRRRTAMNLLPLSLDCTDDGSGATKGPHGGCAQTSGFKQCDESVWEGGWDLHQRRLNNSVKICDGPISKIYCTVHSNKGSVANNAPVARFCWVRNLNGSCTHEVFTLSPADLFGGKTPAGA